MRLGDLRLERRSNGVPWMQRWGAAAAVGGVVVVLAGYILLLGRGAAWLDASSLRGLTPEQRATEIDSMRGYLIQAGAGVLAFGALVYTALNFRLSREGHVTDRYTKAIEQLGSPGLDIRIGAIYALERIMIDSARDHPTIVEVLAAYIREHSRTASVDGDGGQQASDGDAQAAPKPRPDTDVQAALTVLSRRPGRRQERGTLDLTAASLRGALLAGANLRSATLADADLTGIYLTGADLSDGGLSHANLEGAILNDANLTGALLIRANLTDACLISAKLTDAYLTRAKLTGATLSEANLTRANLVGANLSHADLARAVLIGTNLTGADLARADLTGADLTGANLTGADLTNVALTPAQIASAVGAVMALEQSGGGA